jgi:hypothetical protein
MFHVKHILLVDSVSKTYRTRLRFRFTGFSTAPVTVQSRCFEGRLAFCSTWNDLQTVIYAHVPRGTFW